MFDIEVIAPPPPRIAILIDAYPTNDFFERPHFVNCVAHTNQHKMFILQQNLGYEDEVLMYMQRRRQNEVPGFTERMEFHIERGQNAENAARIAGMETYGGPTEVPRSSIPFRFMGSERYTEELSDDEARRQGAKYVTRHRRVVSEPVEACIESEGWQWLRKERVFAIENGGEIPWTIT